MSTTAPPPPEDDPHDVDQAAPDPVLGGLQPRHRAEEGPEALEGELVDPEPDPDNPGTTITAYRHRGPLPPAHELARYEDVHPGLAERIVSMAEREQAHRHEIDRTDVKEPYRLASRGQAFALTAIVLILVFGGVLVFAGSPEAGAIIVGLDLAAIVYAFVRGQRPQDSDGQPPQEPGPEESS